MVLFKSEDVKSRFEGTIIDIETIGEFCGGYLDSREYKDFVPVIFGYITQEGLKIYCAKEKGSLEMLKERVIQILPKLERPFYAFNCCFETGVLFHAWDMEVLFDGELNKEKGEPKWKAVKTLNINNYGDPFNDIGRECKKAWEKGEIEKCITHNRSCLLKERDLLLKRGCRKPDELILYRNS